MLRVKIITVQFVCTCTHTADLYGWIVLILGMESLVSVKMHCVSGLIKIRVLLCEVSHKLRTHFYFLPRYAMQAWPVSSCGVCACVCVCVCHIRELCQKE